MNEDMKALRRVVDIMDHALLDLINRRILLTGHIGEIKAREGLPCQDPGREEDLHLRISLSNSGPLSDRSARRIFEMLMAESRQHQQQRMKQDDGKAS